MSLDRSRLLGPSFEVAPLLLGSVLRVDSAEGVVRVRITEVEAYQGNEDPGSHAFRGKTARNAVMFGEPGHLYTYFTYGMHTCANVVCGEVGVASGLLIRAGQIIEGQELARLRRPRSRGDAELARGPARLTVAAGIALADDGCDLAEGRITLELSGGDTEVACGPRTGVSGPGGSAEFPWRFWIPGESTVSPYKAHAPKTRTRPPRP